MNEQAAICKNCELPIIKAKDNVGEYWYHPRRQSVWCKMANEDNPRRRLREDPYSSPRAEPV